MKGLGLLVIDMQERLLDAIPGAEELVRRCCYAVESARLLDIPMFYTEQSPDKLGKTHRSLMDEGLGSCRGFSKVSFSSFGAAGLVEWMKGEGIKHLLVAGIEVGVCVYQTVLDAKNFGITVTVLTDCVSGRRCEDSQNVMLFLQNESSACLPSETVFYSMLGSADHPQFKSFNQVVKKYN